MRSLAIATALALAASAAGCAAIAAKAPDPDRPRDRPPICNDGKGGVAIDGIMTAALGVATLAFAADGEGGVAAATGLMALGYGLSAASGNSSANKCRAANEEYAAIYEQTEREEIARRYGGGGDATSIGGIPIVDEDVDALGDAGLPPVTPPARPPVVVTPPVRPPAVVTPPATSGDDGDATGDDGSGGGGDGDWSDFWKEVPR